MRETLRDFTIGIGAAAALFAAFQSWGDGGDIARNREAITAAIRSVGEHRALVDPVVTALTR